MKESEQRAARISQGISQVGSDIKARVHRNTAEIKKVSSNTYKQIVASSIVIGAYIMTIASGSIP